MSQTVEPPIDARPTIEPINGTAMIESMERQVQESVLVSMTPPKRAESMESVESFEIPDSAPLKDDFDEPLTWSDSDDELCDERAEPVECAVTERGKHSFIYFSYRNTN